MMTPVKQISAGNVAPMIGFFARPFILKNIEKVVPTFPIDGPIWVKWSRNALWHNEVITRSLAIIEQLLAVLSHNHSRRIDCILQRLHVFVH